MRKILLSAVAAAALFAIPAFAADGLSSDPEIRVQQEWQLLVAKTNADRLAHEQGAVTASGASEMAHSPVGTAGTETGNQYVGPQPAVGTGSVKYYLMQDYWLDR